MPKLTGQQKVFAQEYIRSGFDRLQAIKAAGYSEKNYASIACRLLKKSQIIAEIDRLFDQVEQKCTVEVEEIVRELRKIAFAPIRGHIGQADRLRALDLLGRYKSMWTDRLEINPEREAAKAAMEADEAERLAKLAHQRTEQESKEPIKQPKPPKLFRPDEQSDEQPSEQPDDEQPVSLPGPGPEPKPELAPEPKPKPKPKPAAKVAGSRTVRRYTGGKPKYGRIKASEAASNS